MKLKVCGMTRQADLDAAAEAGFGYCGFIFHAGSCRNVKVELVRQLGCQGMMRVGVFVEQEAAEIEAIMAKARLDLAQLHGSQSGETAMRIGPERVVRVMWPARYAGVEEFTAAAEEYADSCACYLLDAGSGGGGSGKRLAVDWIENISLPRPWFLAGGLAPHNVGDILKRCHPDGLDFNSGLECSPGIKDKNKLSMAVKAVMAEGNNI